MDVMTRSKTMFAVQQVPRAVRLLRHPTSRGRLPHHPGPTPTRRLSNVWSANTTDGAVPSSSKKEGGLRYDKLMLGLADSNPYLSEGSRQALATVAEMASTHQSKVTIVVLDEGGKEKEDVRFDTMSKELHILGCADFDVFTKDLSQKPSVVLGDVADEIKADLVVLSSDAVHEKCVDANLLAEFVPCPLLILP